jgi:hypothetical protein
MSKFDPLAAIFLRYAKPRLQGLQNRHEKGASREACPLLGEKVKPLACFALHRPSKNHHAPVILRMVYLPFMCRAGFKPFIKLTFSHGLSPSVSRSIICLMLSQTSRNAPCCFMVARKPSANMRCPCFCLEHDINQPHNCNRASKRGNVFYGFNIHCLSPFLNIAQAIGFCN